MRTLLRWSLRALAVTGVFAVVLAAIVWLAWIPSPREPAYVFVAAWGGPGDQPGQFNDPTGIAIADGEVFVSDARNGRIQVFGTDGSFRRQFGRPGSAPGELGRPMNLSIRDGALYVPEYFNDRIQVFDLDGTPRWIIGTPGTGAGQFNAPGGVAIAANGDLLVADFYNQRVQRLRPDGRFVRQWGTTAQTGISAGSFNYPTDVAVDAAGNLYVADGYNDRIQVFDANGAFLRKWGGPFAMNVFGPFNGWFATVTSVALDARGNVYAADFYNHRIQKFAPDGTFLTSFGRQGDGAGEFRFPIAVAVDEAGSVFVADYGNQRIQVWRQP